MLLNIYLGSTAISWGVIGLFGCTSLQRIKREGYKWKEEKSTVLENILAVVSVLFKSSIPVYNVIVAAYALLNVDQVYTEIKEKHLENGNIYREKIEELTKEQEEKSTLIDLELHNNFTNSNKTYSEMTLEEKLYALQKEKEFLLSCKSNEQICETKNNVYQK